MKRLMIALAVAGASNAPNLAVAQTAGARPSDDARSSAQQGTIGSARKLIEVMHIEQSYDRVFKPMVGVMAAAILPAMEKDGNVPEAVRDELATNEGKVRVGKVVSEEFMAAFRARYSQLKEATAKEYAAAFTEEELQTIIAFYSSGVGAKALALTPEIAAKVQVQAKAIGEAAGEDAYRHILDRLDTRRGV